MQVNLNGRVALVTGAALGIGRAISLTLAKNGADLVLNDIDRPSAEALTQEIQKLGRRAVMAIADVSDYAQVKRSVNEALVHFGQIDILVNNAGWDKGIIPFLKTDPKDWERVIAINLIGLLNCTHIVGAQMAQRKSGKIINISSDAGRGGSFGEAVYAGCKAGVIALTKTWAREFARDNIRVNCICPGLVDTPLLAKLKQDDLGKKVLERIEQLMLLGLGKPEDIANAVLFFASEESHHITGQVLSVSGGLTFQG
ncbi:glucose 1-dehydrogenase [Candidatus Acetothermia bacterium]|jgi:2-hydroxycyclohexanecarboxyl-CoA dehydrogenase|nr:glucose 1-dehydrogenase [Candidatus Acetothermia bacterium]MCI2432318.1 glucose 1-dehydrogenase [Candidatus Acetothermia bacterium]MCI2437307.1 glucose 1-dehydrogenase [Candidatus Acetothermia bacterium]